MDSRKTNEMTIKLIDWFRDEGLTPAESSEVMLNLFMNTIIQAGGDHAVIEGFGSLILDMSTFLLRNMSRNPIH